MRPPSPPSPPDAAAGPNPGVPPQEDVCLVCEQPILVNWYGITDPDGSGAVWPLCSTACADRWMRDRPDVARLR